MLNRKSIRLGILLTAVAGLLVAPGTGLAQDDPSASQYDPPIPSAAAGEAGESAEAAAGTASGNSGSGLDSPIGSLPFTGMDLLILLAVACLLVGTGMALRKLSTPRKPGV